MRHKLNQLAEDVGPFVDQGKLNTRALSALMTFGEGLDLATLVDQLKTDEPTFRRDLSRTPGCGAQTVNFLVDFLLDLPAPDDPHGRVMSLGYDEATDMQDGLREVLHSVSQKHPAYAPLRRLESLLDAATIHIEQEMDKRPIFRRKNKTV